MSDPSDDRSGGLASWQWGLYPAGHVDRRNLILHGRGHKLEPTAPVRFRGPGDFAARIFIEQWFTFPRYVLTGQLARAWRAAR